MVLEDSLHKEKEEKDCIKQECEELKKKNLDLQDKVINKMVEFGKIYQLVAFFVSKIHFLLILFLFDSLSNPLTRKPTKFFCKLLFKFHVLTYFSPFFTIPPSN